MKYKVIFFDWDGTLSTSKFWDVWVGTDLEEKYYKIQNFFLDNEPIRKWMVGQKSSEEITDIVSKMIKVEESVVFEGLVKSAQKMYINKHVLRTIALIKKTGTKVIIASDNMDTLTRWTAPALNLNKLFDEIINSSDIKALKREKDECGKSLFFNHYLKKYNLQEGESLLIDDSAGNRVVEDFGIEFLKIQRGQLEEVLDESKFF